MAELIGTNHVAQPHVMDDVVINLEITNVALTLARVIRDIENTP